MARRKSDDTLEKVSLNLVKGDFSDLQGYFPKKGAGYAIRKMVHSYLAYLRSKVGPPPDDFELDSDAIEQIMQEEASAERTETSTS